MKFRYVITKFIEAETINEVIKLEKKTPIHEINLHSQWWEKNNYSMKDEDESKKTGFRIGKK